MNAAVLGSICPTHFESRSSVTDGEKLPSMIELDPLEAIIIYIHVDVQVPSLASLHKLSALAPLALVTS